MVFNMLNFNYDNGSESRLLKSMNLSLTMFVSFIMRQANVTHSLAGATLFMANPQRFLSSSTLYFWYYYEWNKITIELFKCNICSEWVLKLEIFLHRKSPIKWIVLNREIGQWHWLAESIVKRLRFLFENTYSILCNIAHTKTANFFYWK